MANENGKLLPPYGKEVDFKLLELIKVAAVEGKRFSWKFLRELLISLLGQESPEVQMKCFSDHYLTTGKSWAVEYCARHHLNPLLANNPKPGYILPREEWTWCQQATDLNSQSENHDDEDAMSEITMFSNLTMSLQTTVPAPASRPAPPFQSGDSSNAASNFKPVFSREKCSKLQWEVLEEQYTVSSGSCSNGSGFSQISDEPIQTIPFGAKRGLGTVVPKGAESADNVKTIKQKGTKRKRAGSSSKRKSSKYISFIDKKPAPKAPPTAFTLLAELQKSKDPYDFSREHSSGIRSFEMTGPYSVISLFTFKGGRDTPTAAKPHARAFLKMLDFVPHADYSLVNVPSKGSCVLYSLIAAMWAASIPFPCSDLTDVRKLRKAVVEYMVNNPMVVLCGKTLLGHFLSDISGQHKDLFENHTDVPANTPESTPWLLQVLAKFFDCCENLKETTTFFEKCPLVVATFLLGVNGEVLCLGGDKSDFNEKAYIDKFEHGRKHTVRLVLSCGAEHCLAAVDNAIFKNLVSQK